MLNNETLLYKGTRKLPDIFNERQINSILNQILICKDYRKGNNEWGGFFKMRDLCLIATIYLLGLRPKEACCLKFEDFNMRTAIVKIRGINNKVRKDRIIPVPELLFRFYKKYFEFPKDRFWRGSPYLFPSLQNQHISPQTFKAIFREKALKPLGLWKMPKEHKIPKIRLYTLRHSRASHILKKQIKEKGQPDIYAIANFLGHSDIRSTQIYLHTDKEYQEYLRGVIEV